jgi:ABC-2 type transport system ATP-binding protein
MNNMIIELSKVSKVYKDKQVLNDVNLSLEKGKGYGFVGINGSGKSVLFKVICGFVRPTHGTIFVNGNQIGEDIDIIRDAGVIIESPNFMNDLSGFNNLLVLAEIKKQIGKQQILEVLERVRLKEAKDKKVKTYSLGMKQRLRIAQAIMEKPSILILDEPMNSLDANAVSEFREIFKEHIQHGGTLLMTSHHPTDIEFLCDKVFEVQEGRIIDPGRKES